ncbi:MAG TPA: hypothetical protein VFG45_11865 [Candidatus Nitrosocosmicus sp.]|nr:hypothetical protein [Candidatus Nitrosocosmicus sp.]
MVLGSCVTNVFAQPPTSGYKSSVDCTCKSFNKKTHCYRTSTRSNLGESYCQTCTINPQIDQASTCDQPELQFRSTSGHVPGDDDDDDHNGGVLKDSEISNKGLSNKIPTNGGVLSNQH